MYIRTLNLSEYGCVNTKQKCMWVIQELVGNLFNFAFRFQFIIKNKLDTWMIKIAGNVLLVHEATRTISTWFAICAIRATREVNSNDIAATEPSSESNIFDRSWLWFMASYIIFFEFWMVVLLFSQYWLSVLLAPFSALWSFDAFFSFSFRRNWILRSYSRSMAMFTVSTELFDQRQSHDTSAFRVQRRAAVQMPSLQASF